MHGSLSRSGKEIERKHPVPHLHDGDEKDGIYITQGLHSLSKTHQRYSEEKKNNKNKS